jgi:hypothetical protein
MFNPPHLIPNETCTQAAKLREDLIAFLEEHQNGHDGDVVLTALLTLSVEIALQVSGLNNPKQGLLNTVAAMVDIYQAPEAQLPSH